MKNRYVWAEAGNELCRKYQGEEWRVPAHPQKRGFKFVGPTIIYAHMQATGLVKFKKNSI